MIHITEHSRPQKRHDVPEVMQFASKVARTFATEEGKVVLAELRKRYGVSRPSFEPSPTGAYDPIAAAIRDGEKNVMLFIEGAINVGAPGQGLAK